MQCDPKSFMDPTIFQDYEMCTNDKREFLKPSLCLVYFSRSEKGPICGVYNLTREEADTIVLKVKDNRDISYENLLRDMSDVIYGDEGKLLKHKDVKGQVSILKNQKIRGLTT